MDGNNRAGYIFQLDTLLNDRITPGAAAALLTAIRNDPKNVISTLNSS